MKIINMHTTAECLSPGDYILAANKIVKVTNVIKPDFDRLQNKACWIVEYEYHTHSGGHRFGAEWIFHNNTVNLIVISRAADEADDNE